MALQDPQAQQVKQVPMALQDPQAQQVKQVPMAPQDQRDHKETRDPQAQQVKQVPMALQDPQAQQVKQVPMAPQDQLVHKEMMLYGTSLETTMLIYLILLETLLHTRVRLGIDPMLMMERQVILPAKAHSGHCWPKLEPLDRQVLPEQEAEVVALRCQKPPQSPPWREIFGITPQMEKHLYTMMTFG
jgi:hypothetical protein